jgi:uncharacterized OB-fold protein/acyl dehydratase
MTPDSSNGSLEAALQQFIGRTIGPPVCGRDPVSEPAIRQFCDVIGDAHPAYRDTASASATAFGAVVAPPAMMQSWVLQGWGMQDERSGATNEQERLYDLLSQHGYTGALGTSSEEHYERYLRPGDKVTSQTVIEDISGPKTTGLGEGWFITTRTTFTDQAGAEVGWILFRVLKFAPLQTEKQAGSGKKGKGGRIKPPMAHDNAWWWQAVAERRLPIQRCVGCDKLRHPPRPMCDGCGSLEFDSIDSAGRGTVHSFSVIEHPKFPGYDYPLIAVLVDLEEGERIVSNLVDCRPQDCRIGMPVEVSFHTDEGDFTLPLFRPAGAAQ